MHMNMLVCRLTRIQDTAYVKRRQQSTSANRARVDHRQSAFVWSFAHRMFVVQSLPPGGGGGASGPRNHPERLETVVRSDGSFKNADSNTRPHTLSWQVVALYSKRVYFHFELVYLT